MTEATDRRRKYLEARADVLAKHGTVDAALSPCARERLILAAVSPWRTTLPPPNDGWTHALDGWTAASHGEPPSQIVAAISGAYQMPATFGEALTEARHWQNRNEEIALVLDEAGADCLDLATSIRAAEVRKLLEHVLPATSAAEMLMRFRLFRQRRFNDGPIAEALLRDLTALADRERQTAQPATAPARKPTDDLTAAIRAALDVDHARSDRDIARSCECSPTTVGKVRREKGLVEVVRSVRRGNQIYEMTVCFGENLK